MSDTLNHKVAEALSGLAAEAPLRVGAAALLGALGYESRRTLDVGSVQEFLERLNSAKQLTERQHALFEPWRAVEVVFQFTGNEIGGQPSLFDGMDGFDQGRIESFLFLAVELSEERYGRTQLAEMTRVANRLFKMPVIIFFRHGTTLTLAAVHRRAHKRDGGRDVLERVTLVKDIRVDQAHRAHVEILGDLALPRLMAEGVRDFDHLHAAWERVLDIEALNRRFYKELFGWFERAVQACSFPDDGAGDGGTERHVIRLITRLLFIWFLKEKGLVTDELFEEHFARTALKHHPPDRTDYYRAVLQNLFFATLNTEVDRRAFSKNANATHRDFTKYRYRSLLADPEGFIKNLEQVPFVNGGLFDCLDDFAGIGAGGRRIDAFTDNATQGRDLNVPAHLFFDPKDGLFPLFRHYKFTVEENTPLDREVALDPELLGRVFENLLASYNPETRQTARKASGSYYTPRQVVDYMVQEVLTEALAARTQSADGDITYWRERLSYLLDHSDAMDDADEFFEESDKRTVVAAIANIRALDPAVGSGAFPMGILQTLTLALRRLDPRNTLWEEFQKEQAKARAGEAFDTRDQQIRDDALREISHTFEKYRQSDFGRKLYLIQNSIYGVDIQPIACQIAKLRFFISLVIEQDPDPGAPNLGIKPLPNLETRFVAADTLIGLQAETASLLLDDAVKSKRVEVAAVRERYFLADSRPTKLDCIAAEQRLRLELQDMLEDERRTWIAVQERDIESTAKALPNPDVRKTFRENELGKLALRQRAYDAALADARKVAAWDPYDQNARASWFEAEYMFGVQGGFDVVLGNPPYIQLQKDGGLLGKRYQNAGYETFARTGDIYQLFYERGCGLLRPGAGTLAYITSNSWLKAEYGKPLRRWLAERHTPLRLIEMGKDVFDAIVDTGVLAIREGGNADRLPAVDMDGLDDGAFPPPERQWREARPSGEAPWSILSAVEWRVLDKMKTKGTLLRDWDVRINYGIKTGYNKAFIIDDATRDALIDEDPHSAKIIKPVLRGRDIRRWRARWARKWLIATLPSLQLNINDYPAVKRHLLSFGKARLEQTGKLLHDGNRARKKTAHAWFELQDSIAYHEEFSQEKLFWMDLTDRGRFSYDSGEMFAANTAYVLVGKPVKYLCAVLNSKLATWFMENGALTSGMGVTRWFSTSVSGIPIPLPPSEKQSPLVQLVDAVIANKDADPDAETAEEEREIDRLVYELYGLNRREITTVEGVARS